MPIRTVLAVVAALLFTGPAWTADLTATPETQAAVLAQVKGGDTLTLTGGFGVLQLKDRQFSPPLEVKAGAATFRAVIVRNLDGLRWTGGTFQIRGGRTGITVAQSNDVQLDRLVMEGDGLSNAVFFDASRDVSLTGSRLEKARGAITLRNVDRARIEGNMVWRWTANGVSLESVGHSTIRQNSFVARMRVDDVHPDGIQGLQSKGRPNHHITIANNYIGGDDSQGIFMQRAWEGYEQAHDISIIDNVVVTSNAPNGIRLEGDPNGIVTGNRISTLPGSQWQTKLTTDAPVRSGNTVAAYGRWAASAD